MPLLCPGQQFLVLLSEAVEKREGERDREPWGTERDRHAGLGENESEREREREGENPEI